MEADLHIIGAFETLPGDQVTDDEFKEELLRRGGDLDLSPLPATPCAYAVRVPNLLIYVRSPLGRQNCCSCSRFCFGFEPSRRIQ